ncbi:MAG: PCRF domain-containing protein, partial [Desulfuromonas thiophila]|nr:PCRF domain-containing protein [Desulfuromonas thiophila]
MFDKLEAVVDRFHEIEGLLSDPAVLADQERFRALTREHAELAELVATYTRYCRLRQQRADNEELLRDGDADLRELARAELAELESQQQEQEQLLRQLMLPRDPNDGKNIVLEIRAGTGGDEAALFAADLFRAYCRYADRQRWKVEILSASEAGVGGFKEVIAVVSGQNVYSRLKYESGTH